MNVLDQSINNDLLVVAKTLVPYLDANKQRVVAIGVKLAELISTIAFYADEDNITDISRDREPGWERKFLTDVKENLSEDKAYYVDVVLKITEALNLLLNQPLNTALGDEDPEDAVFGRDADALEYSPDNALKSYPKARTAANNTANVLGTLSSTLLDPKNADLLKAVLSMITPKAPAPTNTPVKQANTSANTN